MEQEEIASILDRFLDTSHYRQDLTGLEKGQTPKIFAVFCSDSRVEARAFAENPLNYVFGAETIGNHITGIMGSAGYAVDHLKTVKLIAVIGHIGCGAVSAAYKLSRNLAPEFYPKDLQEAVAMTVKKLMEPVKAAIVMDDAEEAIVSEMKPVAQFFANVKNLLGDDEEQYLPKHAEANVHLQVGVLLALKQLKDDVKNGKRAVVGCIYDFTSRYGGPGTLCMVNINGSIPDVYNNPSVKSFMEAHSQKIRTFI